MIAAAMVGAVVIAAAFVTAGVIFETGYLLGRRNEKSYVNAAG